MTPSLFMSSGDLVADRRFDFARDLLLRGDAAAAIDLLRQALEIAPRFASAWFVLGEACERDGRIAEAVDAFRAAAAHDADDRHGATLRLMRLGARPLAAMPRGYVQALFDQYAPRFDRALTQDLAYRGPALLREAVGRACAARKPLRFPRAVDLGCGTGLAAQAFAPLCDEMIGVDLSPAMLAHAQRTGLYARLVAADMAEALAQEDDARFDLALAADAFVYLDDLGPVLAQCARVLKDDGALAFSVETHDGAGVILKDTLRYGHGVAAVRDALAASGLAALLIEGCATRLEKDEPVPSLVVVARKDAA